MIDLNDHDIFVILRSGFNQLMSIHPAPGGNVILRPRIGADRLNLYAVRKRLHSGLHTDHRHGTEQPPAIDQMPAQIIHSLGISWGGIGATLISL